MHQHRIKKGQKTIYIIQRRTAISFLKRKTFFLRNNQIIKDTKISMRGIAFQPTNGIKRWFNSSDFSELLNVETP